MNFLNDEKFRSQKTTGNIKCDLDFFLCDNLMYM